MHGLHRMNPNGATPPPEAVSPTKFIFWNKSDSKYMWPFFASRDKSSLTLPSVLHCITMWLLVPRSYGKTKVERDRNQYWDEVKGKEENLSQNKHTILLNSVVITTAITGRTIISLESVEHISQLHPMQEHQETLPLFKPSVAGLLLRRPRFDTRPGYVRYVVDKVALSQVLRVRLFLPFKFIPTSPVDARSKAWVCGRSFVGIAGSNPTVVMEVCPFWVWCVVR